MPPINQSNLQFRRKFRLKNFKTAAIILDIGTERNDFRNSDFLCRSDASYQVSTQSDMVLEEMSFDEFQDGHHLGFWNKTISEILHRYAAPMPPIKFHLNPTYGF